LRLCGFFVLPLLLFASHPEKKILLSNKTTQELLTFGVRDSDFSARTRLFVADRACARVAGRLEDKLTGRATGVRGALATKLSETVLTILRKAGPPEWVTICTICKMFTTIIALLVKATFLTVDRSFRAVQIQSLAALTASDPATVIALEMGEKAFEATKILAVVAEIDVFASITVMCPAVAAIGTIIARNKVGAIVASEAAIVADGTVTIVAKLNKRTIRSISIP